MHLRKTFKMNTKIKKWKNPHLKYPAAGPFWLKGEVKFFGTVGVPIYSFLWLFRVCIFVDVRLPFNFVELKIFDSITYSRPTEQRNKFDYQFEIVSIHVDSFLVHALILSSIWCKGTINHSAGALFLWNEIKWLRKTWKMLFVRSTEQKIKCNNNNNALVSVYLCRPLTIYWVSHFYLPEAVTHSRYRPEIDDWGVGNPFVLFNVIFSFCGRHRHSLIKQTA